MKILFTHNDEVKDGFESKNPDYISEIPTESVDEIEGTCVLEKVPNLIDFIENSYRILKFGSKATFTCSYYASTRAWASPLTIRGLSEYSLSFSQKQWREDNKYTEAVIKADFDVSVQFLLEQTVTQKAEPVRLFWMNKYLNVVQSVMFTLTKKVLDEKK